ncbi:MAG: hypothetical protein QM627_05575 [Luteolibacter sp.]
MKTCDCCGNHYEQTFDVEMGGRSYTFDSFECAIHLLAPVCPACQCRIIGHGVEGEGGIYCCAHCARRQGVEGVVDNADHADEA